MVGLKCGHWVLISSHRALVYIGPCGRRGKHEIGVGYSSKSPSSKMTIGPGWFVKHTVMSGAVGSYPHLAAIREVHEVKCVKFMKYP